MAGKPTAIDLLGEPARCIHVGDRESDTFELYCLTRELGTHFIVRMQTDRLAGNGDHTISEEMDNQQDRRLARPERDFGNSVETLALFVRFWLTTTPPLPEPAAKAVRAQAAARYDNFIAALGRRLNQGPKLRQEIPEDVKGHTNED